MSTEATHSVVQLPARMEAEDVLAVHDELRARIDALHQGRHKHHAALPKGCPEHATIAATVTAAWKRLATSCTELSAITAQRVATPEDPAQEVAKTVANNASDNAWRAFDPWLAGWGHLEDDGDEPAGVEASALHAQLFPAPNGLRFIGWRPRKQWTAMQTRMTALAKPETVALVEGLGGARMLAALQRTHAAFGSAYGFTEAHADKQDDSVDARPQFLAAKDTLRDFVKKVEGSADHEVEGTEAVASWLLGPYHRLVADFAAQPAKASKRTKAAATPETAAPK